MLCRRFVLIWLLLFCSPGAAENQGPEPADFKALEEALWPRAMTAGISRATFDAAFAGRVPNPQVLAATRTQPEYNVPFGEYINSAVSQRRIEDGIKKSRQWSKTLESIQERFGVDRWILCGIWGLESSYGEEKGHYDVIVSLATLAAVQYRAPQFDNELLAALRMLQTHIPRDKMVGSWAGAMGQPQFMPSIFSEYAATFSGKGEPDIWSNVPDSLASIANYLHQANWVTGLPWGFEITVPAAFDYRHSRASFKEWSTLGIKRTDGGKLPPSGDAILFFPAGAKGPAFLVTANFVAIKRYNNSDAYALAVGYLADRLQGRPPIKAGWPADDYQLKREERIALQIKLKALGYPIHDFQGHIDFDLRDAIRDEQQKFAMIPDGYPTSALLKRLGVVPGR